MSQINNGGPVFPCKVPTGFMIRGENGEAAPETKESIGMTLRDYFAAAALRGLLSGRIGVSDKAYMLDAEKLAGMSYAFANAMLKAIGE